MEPIDNIRANKGQLKGGLFKHKRRFITHATELSSLALRSQDALAAMLAIIKELFDAAVCSLFLHDPEGDHLELITGSATDRKFFSTSSLRTDEGICGCVFQNETPYTSGDTALNIVVGTELARGSSTMPVMAAPLMLSELCLGTVVVLRHGSRVFNADEVEQLNRLTEGLALTVENEHLFEKCCHQLAQRNRMLDIAKEVNTSRELEDLLNYIVVTAAELLNAEASSLLLREGEELRFEIAFGEKAAEIKEFKVPLGAGIAGAVALSGESTFLNEIDVEGSNIFKEIDEKSGFQTRNLICVPLRVKDRIIGVVEVINTRDKDVFSRDDIALLEGFASEAAIALERAQLVEERIQSERLATIGRTVSGLAHCIKNITNALKAGEYIVEKGFRDDSMEGLRKGWDIMRSGSERIRSLVLDMLTIAKKREPEYSTCYPHEIAEDVVEMVAGEAREKSIRIETSFDPDIGPVQVDRNNIFRCLLNLNSNALDACPEGEGQICVESFMHETGDLFGYRIRDNGHGITRDDQKKLFHEFFSTKGSKGTGLGLSVTSAIVKEHGGSIRCESEPGEGTVFTIELPVRH